MIKKLEKHIGTIKAGNVSYDAMKPASINEMHEKINELVDAVNEILDYAPLEMAMKAEPKTRAKNVRPPYIQNKRLRKALDVAVDALKLFDSGQYTLEPDPYGLKRDASRLARKTLAEIKTALTKGGDNE